MGYYSDFSTHICILYINVHLKSCITNDYLIYEDTLYLCYSAILLQCTQNSCTDVHFLLYELFKQSLLSSKSK